MTHVQAGVGVTHLLDVLYVPHDHTHVGIHHHQLPLSLRAEAAAPGVREPFISSRACKVVRKVQ
jgi:hypothetical protein